MKERPIRVILADDHEILVHGLRNLLEIEDDFAVVGSVADGAQVLDAALGECDVLVLDLSLPRFGGIEVLRRVRAAHPNLKVVVFSMYPADQFAARVLDAGAHAYVAKNTRSDELLDAIRRVARGLPAPQTAGSARPRMPHDTLSPREYQVFTLLCDGRRTSDIAAEMDVAPSTVSNHVAKIKLKLGVESLAAIIAYGMRIGIVGGGGSPED